jgi:hypothetical protein
MNYEELKKTVDKQRVVIDDLRLEMDKLKEMIQYSSKSTDPLQTRVNNLESMVNERYRIGTDLMLCKIITGTTDATAGTESTHEHKLTKTPRFTFVLPTMKSYVYQSKVPDSSNIYLKASENSTTFTALVIY